LQWSDIDFRSGFLEVRRAVVRREVISTKNHKLRRVDMSPQLIDALHHMRETRELEATGGIRRVRFHDLRHTYVSLMAQQGSPTKYVQEQCGHSSIQVTMDIYAHLFPSGNKEWCAKLDSVQTPLVAPHTHPERVGAGR
jgi:integrase